MGILYNLYILQLNYLLFIYLDMQFFLIVLIILHLMLLTQVKQTNLFVPLICGV